jgi:Putative transposase
MARRPASLLSKLSGLSLYNPLSGDRCCTGRMNETAAHLVEHVSPEQPVRQWVLSVPKRLRYFMQRDSAALNCAQRLFLRVIRSTLIKHCLTTVVNEPCHDDLQIGAVAFIHRFGSTLNEHIYLDVCLIDGAFKTADQATQFYSAKPFSIESVELAADFGRRDT